MKYKFLLLGFILAATSCVRSQETKYNLVGAPCEGCEAVLEYGSRNLNTVDTLPEFSTADKKLKISGTIYEQDGKSPAEGVILYIHHTNADGIYPTLGNEKGWARRHGYLQGWIKTGTDGKYTFFTQMPGTYPSRDTPAHIHPYILEPNGKYYWLGSYFFKGDPLLTKEHLTEQPRGGSNGVVKPKMRNGMFEITRDFILGKNVPGYE